MANAIAAMTSLRRRVALQAYAGLSASFDAACSTSGRVVDLHAAWPCSLSPQDVGSAAKAAATAAAGHGHQWRCMTGQAQSPVQRKLQGLRSAFQLPPNPFTHKPVRYLGPKQVLYRGKGMLLFRFLVRMKVFQLAGVFMVASLMSMVMASDSATAGDIAAAAAVALGCVVTSYCVWYYSGRYVGELSLVLPDRDRVCFSVLDFWGSRQDNLVPLSQLDPPFRNRSVAEVKAMVRPPLMPVKTQDQEYYISMGHGTVLDEQVLLNILYGKPLDTAQQQQEQHVEQQQGAQRQQPQQHQQAP